RRVNHASVTLARIEKAPLRGCTPPDGSCRQRALPSKPSAVRNTPTSALAAQRPLDKSSSRDQVPGKRETSICPSPCRPLMLFQAAPPEAARALESAAMPDAADTC